MSRYTQTKCPKCPSSDAYTIYEDGAYCYSCGYTTKEKDNEMDRSNNSLRPVDFHGTRFAKDLGIGPHTRRYRNISENTYNKFGVGRTVDSQFYPYTKDGELVGYKQRVVEDKKFFAHGNITDCDLFMQSYFQAGGKRLVITEGEVDALSIAEAFQQKHHKVYPVVSIPSATGTKAILNNRDWVRSFDEVVLWFDNDEAGKKATKEAAKIIGMGKARVVQVNFKDANQMLEREGINTVAEAVWKARLWSPAGIIMGEDIWDKFKERKDKVSIPYPDCLDGLNDKLKGIRHGEITLFTSGTGSGKSTVIKEIILDLLSKTEDKIGLISLEESIGDTAEKFIHMVLKRNALTSMVSETELRDGYVEVFGDERLVLLDHQGSVGDSSLIDKIEYMALMGCKYLVLDHITIAVSEGSEGLSGNEAVDKVMSDLLKIVKRHNIWLGIVSHLRKTFGGKSFEEGNIASIDDIKGSGSIKQISFDIIAFSRNLVAQDEAEKNVIKFRVLKSRFTGLTGDAGSATYDLSTTRLKRVGEFNVV